MVFFVALLIVVVAWIVYTRVVRSRSVKSSSPSTPTFTVFDENVQFTTYRPDEIEPHRWYQVLVFAHLSRARENEPHEPDPLQEVSRQARALLTAEPANFQPRTVDSAHPIPRHGELTVEPRLEGVEFNPSRTSFRWERSVHRADFQMRAAGGQLPRVARGRIAIFLNGLIVADIALVIRVVERVESVHLDMGGAARRYRTVFASYSHDDRTIVETVERYVQTVGDRYLRDVHDLRSGQVWSEELRDLIRRADVFQLFWSWNALSSTFVRDEWEYALSLGRPDFVRPVYWEEPLPATDALPPDSLRRLHFHRIAVGSAEPGIQTNTRPLGSLSSGVARSALGLLVAAVTITALWQLQRSPVLPSEQIDLPSVLFPYVGSPTNHSPVAPPTGTGSTAPPIKKSPTPAFPAPPVGLPGSIPKSARPAGLAGLLIEEIEVQGVIHLQGPNERVALVAANNGRAYTIRPGDRLLDGVVRAISEQFVTFVQDVQDPLSLEKQREVRKYIRRR